MLGLPAPENVKAGTGDACSTDVYPAQVDALLRAAPPVISFVMGVPSSAVVDPTHESGASPVHKQALLAESARTTVLTRVFSGRTARATPNRFQREMAVYEDDVPAHPLQNQLTQALRAAANERGLVDYVHLWAGQAAPLAGSRAAAEYLRALVSQTRSLLAPDG
jgi:hypothetical protein